MATLHHQFNNAFGILKNEQLINRFNPIKPTPCIYTVNKGGEIPNVYAILGHRRALFNSCINWRFVESGQWLFILLPYTLVFKKSKSLVGIPCFVTFFSIRLSLTLLTLRCRFVYSGTLLMDSIIFFFFPKTLSLINYFFSADRRRKEDIYRKKKNVILQKSTILLNNE